MTAVIVAVLAVVVIGGLLALERRKALREAAKIPFGESVDTIGLPVVPFTVGGVRLNFVLDSGANINYIDAKVIAESHVASRKVEGNATFYGIDGNTSGAMVVEMDLSHGDRTFTTEFAVCDLSKTLGNFHQECGIVVHGFLGSLFFEKYKYVLDFAELKAYQKR